MIGRRGRRESQTVVHEAADLTGDMAAAIEAIRPGDARPIDEVAEVLLRAGDSHDHAAVLQVLRMFAARPEVVVRLDERLRRMWSSGPSAAAAGPAGTVLASTHRDGHIREQAVAAVLAAPDPAWMPFLVLRTADWVAPVRERARYGLAVLLGGQAETYLPAVLPTAAAVGEWRRGGFAHGQALATLSTATPRLRDQLVATANASQRRFLLGLGRLDAGYLFQPTGAGMSAASISAAVAG